jgi:hypothetical protein
LRSELRDRFGDVPEEVENLIFQLRVRLLAMEADVTSISTEIGQIMIQLPNTWPRERIPQLGPSVRLSKRGLWVLLTESHAWKSTLVGVLEQLIQTYRSCEVEPVLE